MGQDAEADRSHLIDVFEAYFGTDLEEAQSDAISKLDGGDLLDLADLVDHSLNADRSVYRFDSSCALPIPYTNDWSADRLASETESARLALLHPRVVVPVGNVRARVLNDPFTAQATGRQVDSATLVTLHKWSLKNAEFIRNGSILPLAHDVYITRAVSDACYNAVLATDVAHLRDNYAGYAPVIDGLPDDECDNIVRGSMGALFLQTFVARKLRITPVMTSRQTINLWNDLLSLAHTIALSSGASQDLSSTLLRLPLPGLLRISQADICTLQNDSEAFAVWRDRLTYVLRNVHRRVSEGDDVKTALNEEALPLREAARGIEREIESTSIADKLKQVKSTFIVGGAATLANAELINALGNDPNIGTNLLKLGPPGIIAFFWWLLFDRPKSTDSAILRVYNAFCETE